MEDTPDGDKFAPYTRRQWIRAVNWAALVGWSIVVAPLLLSVSGIFTLPWAALFGLPIAFALTWAFAGPIVWLIMRRQVSWLSAAIWGAVTSALMALVGFAFARFQGWQASQDPYFNYTIGGGDFVQNVDGVLTPYGLQVELLQSLKFIVLGTAVALIVRAIIGAGQKTAAK